MATSSTINPATFLYEGALFSRQNDLVTPWNTFCDEVMAKIAGTSTPGAEPGDRGTRKRGPSKTAQAILAVLTSDGLAKRSIVSATGLTAEQVATALPGIQKSRLAYLRNGRWFPGPAQAKTAGRPRAGSPNSEQDLEAKKTVGRQRKARTSKSPSGTSLSDATIKAVEATGKEGAGTDNILAYLSREFGMTVRPNHLGIALQRHRRAARLQERAGRWYTPNVAEFRQAS